MKSLLSIIILISLICSADSSSPPNDIFRFLPRTGNQVAFLTQGFRHGLLLCRPYFQGENKLNPMPQFEGTGRGALFPFHHIYFDDLFPIGEIFGFSGIIHLKKALQKFRRIAGP